MLHTAGPDHDPTSFLDAAGRPMLGYGPVSYAVQWNASSPKHRNCNARRRGCPMPWHHYGNNHVQRLANGDGFRHRRPGADRDVLHNLCLHELRLFGGTRYDIRSRRRHASAKSVPFPEPDPSADTNSDAYVSPDSGLRITQHLTQQRSHRFLAPWNHIIIIFASAKYSS